MFSIPYSLLSKSNSSVLPQSTISEHQNFCKLFSKAQTLYERKKDENNKSKEILSSDENNQSKIWNWFENLSLEKKIKICTIKNKWIVKIIIQLYFIYAIDNRSTFDPTSEMNLLFTNNQKNFQNLGLLNFSYKNIHIIPNYKEKKNYIGYNEDDYCKLYFNIKESDYSMIKKDENIEKIKFEKKLLNNIILLSIEDESLDTISLNKKLLKDFNNFKQILNYFSEKKFFKDWLIPFNCNNNYLNFSFPIWMHNNHELSLCQIISGIFEQQILLSYEYYFYTNKIYEFKDINIILDIYKENKNLENFINENYSYEDNNNLEIKKEKILTLNIITDIINKIKTDTKLKKKFDNFKKMCDQLYNDYYKSQFYNGNKILIDADENIYKELNYEMTKEKGKEIHLLLNKITFINLEDVKNYREYIYLFLRKYLIDLRNKKFINELINEDENKINKKKKKKRKNKNKNNSINITQNENILNNNNNIVNDKINEKEKDLINNTINNFEKEQNNEIQKDKVDTFIELRKNNNNEEIENSDFSKNNLKIKNKEFFLFPLNNKKKKEKEKEKIINNINENNLEKKLIEKQKTKDNIIEENIKDKEEIKKEKKEDIDNKKENKKNLNNENSQEDLISNNLLNNHIIEQKETKEKKIELLKTSEISLQMLNSSYSKNLLSYNNNSFENNKFVTSPEKTTSFSFEPSNKDEKTTKSVNMTINIINNQYICQQYPSPFMNLMFCNHKPSELFFDFLTKEINSYYLLTCKNNEYLNLIKKKYLNKIENLIKIGLEKKYKIQFGHYGSYFTNLSIEGSDIDILVFYKSIEPNNNFLDDIINLLNENKNEFDDIYPILSASVPVIKLQKNISNEINNKVFNFFPYLENKDLSHIKIDLTFTSDENEFKRPEQIVSYINRNVKEFSDIKPLLLVLKRYFRIMKMNKSYTGGLSSYSLFLLILSFLKDNNNNFSFFSLGKSLYYILEKYSFFDYQNYGIDVEGPQFFYLLNKKFNNYQNKIEEINILDPFTKLNVAKSSFQVNEIKNTFNKALFFFMYESWEYDSNNYNSNNFIINNNNNNNKNIDNNDDKNNFIIIKKLFSIK